jgi:sugar (pentulose or hexulose) kinase
LQLLSIETHIYIPIEQDILTCRPHHTTNKQQADPFIHSLIMTDAHPSTTITAFLGIDVGTQGLSVVLTNEDLQVLAHGEGSYTFLPGLPEGHYEQEAHDWETALHTAMQPIHAFMQQQQAGILTIRAIGIAGQMHGQVLCDADGHVLAPVRVWCDARNADEGMELTEQWQIKVPKRATVARWLYTVRRSPEFAHRVRHMTTPAGWIAYCLTGEWNLGVGDASGMFPVQPDGHCYHETCLEDFDANVVNNASIPSLRTLLPTIRRAGEPAGVLSESGAALLGLPAGIPVAPAEGDQVASLAGSLIGQSGSISCSLGTSAVTNVISGGAVFTGVSPAVDHFCAADGQPIHMVCLRNGTTYLNTIVASYGKDDTGHDAASSSSAFDRIMPQLIQAPPDCGGILALPFMDDEPALQVNSGGTALLVGLNARNATPGNLAKAALLSTLFNLRLGCQVLEQQRIPLQEIVLSGGLTKTPECGQIVADIMNLPVRLLPSAEEGCSLGAALLASYRYQKSISSSSSTKEAAVDDWPAYLEALRTATGRTDRCFQPIESNVQAYTQVYERYQRLVALQPHIAQAVAFNR